MILTSKRKTFNLRNNSLNYQVESLLLRDEEAFHRQSSGSTTVSELRGDRARQ